MDQSFVRIGDRICLLSEEAKGYLCSTGLNHPNFYVQKSGETKQALVPDLRNMVFRCYPKLNYNLSRDYEKLRSKMVGNSSTIKNNKQVYNQYLERLRVFEERKENEMLYNENHFINQQGTMIY